jgi:hypothetical protein
MIPDYIAGITRKVLIDAAEIVVREVRPDGGSTIPIFAEGISKPVTM